MVNKIRGALPELYTISTDVFWPN